MIAHILASQSWQDMVSNDFNRGFVTGFAVAAAIVVLLLLAWLILNLTVWSHRSSSMKVSTPDGDIVITRMALFQAIERELFAFPELKLIRVRLFKDNAEYRLALNCEFRGASGLIEVADRVRPKLKEALHKIFGVESICAVGIVIERYNAPADGSVTAEGK